MCSGRWHHGAAREDHRLRHLHAVCSTSCPAACLPSWESSRTSSWPGLCLASPGCCSHLGSDQWVQDHSLSPSLPVSPSLSPSPSPSPSFSFCLALSLPLPPLGQLRSRQHVANHVLSLWVRPPVQAELVLCVAYGSQGALRLLSRRCVTPGTRHAVTRRLEHVGMLKTCMVVLIHLKAGRSAQGPRGPGAPATERKPRPGLLGRAQVTPEGAECITSQEHLVALERQAAGRVPAPSSPPPSGHKQKEA